MKTEVVMAVVDTKSNYHTLKFLVVLMHIKGQWTEDCRSCSGIDIRPRNRFSGHPFSAIPIVFRGSHQDKITRVVREVDRKQRAFIGNSERYERPRVFCVRYGLKWCRFD